MQSHPVLVLGPATQVGGLVDDLRKAGHAPFLALDPFQAAALAPSVKPTAIYVVGSPGTALNGALEALVQHPGCSGVPIVVLLNDIKVLSLVTLLTQGAAAVLPVKLTADALLTQTFELVGDSPTHPARTRAIDARVSSGLLRLAQHLEGRQEAVSLEIETDLGRASFVFTDGHLTSASFHKEEGAAALRAFFAVDSGQRWDVKLVNTESLAPSSKTGASTPSRPPLPALTLQVPSSTAADFEVDIELDVNTLPAFIEAPDDQLDAFGMPRIVLADDDRALLDLYNTLMSKRGWEVTLAADGVEAMEKILEVRPDVVVSDIMMPRLDGWSLLARHRSDFRVSEIPMMMLSCQGDYLERLGRVVAGAQDYIEKGIRGKILLSRIEAVMAPRRRFAAGLKAQTSFKVGIGTIGPRAVLEGLERIKASGRLLINARSTHCDILFSEGLVVDAHATRGGEVARDPKGALLMALALRDGVAGFAAAELPPPENSIQFSAKADHLAEILNQQFLNTCERVIHGDARLQPTSHDIAAVYVEACPDEVRGPALAILSSEDTDVDETLRRQIIEDMLRKGVALEAA